MESATWLLSGLKSLCRAFWVCRGLVRLSYPKVYRAQTFTGHYRSARPAAIKKRVSSVKLSNATGDPPGVPKP